MNVSSPVSFQTQSLALRALRKRKPQETQALALASSQSWLPLLRPSIPIGWRLRLLREIFTQQTQALLNGNRASQITGELCDISTIKHLSLEYYKTAGSCGYLTVAVNTIRYMNASNTLYDDQQPVGCQLSLLYETTHNEWTGKENGWTYDNAKVRECWRHCAMKTLWWQFMMRRICKLRGRVKQWRSDGWWEGWQRKRWADVWKWRRIRMTLKQWIGKLVPNTQRSMSKMWLSQKTSEIIRERMHYGCWSPTFIDATCHYAAYVMNLWWRPNNTSRLSASCVFLQIVGLVLSLFFF